MIRALLFSVLVLGCAEEKKKTEPEPAPLKMEPQDTAPAAAPDTAPAADTYVAPEDTSVVDTGPAPKGPHKKLNLKPPIITK